jgi:hypothetical protein
MQIAGITPQQMVRTVILGRAVFGGLTTNRRGYADYIPQRCQGGGPEQRMC